MAKYISNKVANKQPVISGDDKGTLIADDFTVAVDVNLAANDLILFGKLPNSHEPVDGYVASDQLDSNGAPTLTLTFGILNDAGDDLVANTDFLTADATIGRTANSFTRFDNVLGLTLPAVTAVDQVNDKGTKNTYVRNGDRILAAKVIGAAATKVAGNITTVFTYRAV